MSLESTDLLTSLRLRLRTETIGTDEHRFAITSLSKLEAHFLPSKYDLPYSDVIIVAQTTAVGSCYCYSEDPSISNDVLGQDARYVSTASRCVDIALLDAAYAELLPTPVLHCRLQGSPSQKAEARASLILAEVGKLASEVNRTRPRIVMVGAVGNVLAGLSSHKWDIFATDLDPSLIGQKLGGVLVENGHTMTLARVRQSDVAIITGMTLATNSLDRILTVAKRHGVKILMFSQTGANLASPLIDLGVDCVVSEEFPFYMFPGATSLRVYRRE